MKSYSSREVMRMLMDDGWKLKNVEGSHHHFTHPIKKGKVTMKHPTKSIPPKTLKNILDQAGITLK